VAPVAASVWQLRYLFVMTLEFLQHHWAILVASVLVLAIALFVALRAFEDSARGRLMRLVRLYDDKVRVAHKARKVASNTAAKLQKLHAKRDSAIPRHVQETSEALEDAKALTKIADDQVLIAANHVRRIILEEFPPQRHDSLRAKYLPVA
jgi:hypothetical protein